MRKVRKLNILDLEYVIEYVANIEDSKGSPMAGACVPEKQQIYIKDEGVTPTQQELTLLHEVLHAMAAEVAPKVYLDEDVISAFTFALWKFFRDNKKWW